MIQHHHQVNKEETAEKPFCCLCGGILEAGIMQVTKIRKDHSFGISFLLDHSLCSSLLFLCTSWLTVANGNTALQNTVLLKNVKLRYLKVISTKDPDWEIYLQMLLFFTTFSLENNAKNESYCSSPLTKKDGVFIKKRTNCRKCARKKKVVLKC